MVDVPDPRSAPAIRWGILGAGGIAGAFAWAVRQHTAGEVVAVGSRSLERAQRFAAEYGIASAYGDYQALVTDPRVQAVYVATPHSEHRGNSLLAIGAGKHVLVEKAFTRDAAQAVEVFAAARAAGVFAMEAMWTRFLPHVAALREVLARGEIGEVVGVLADHGQNMGHLTPTHRLHDPALAGGALLDLGVYPVSFALDLLGTPDRIRAVGSLTDTGVDGQVSLALGFGPRVQASLHTTLWATTSTTAAIVGTAGRIEVATHFYRPTTFQVVPHRGERWSYRHQVEGGLQFEAAEVAVCVAEGRAQSERMSWASSVEVMRVLDEARRQTGVVYPGEAPG